MRFTHNSDYIHFFILLVLPLFLRLHSFFVFIFRLHFSFFVIFRLHSFFVFLHFSSFSVFLHSCTIYINSSTKVRDLSSEADTVSRVYQ